MKKDPNITFVKEWDILKKLMWTKNCVVGPMRFLRMTKIIAQETDNDMFVSEDQNDVTEFMYFLLECFHQGMKNVDNHMYTKFLKSLLDNQGPKYMKIMKKILDDDFSYVNTLFQGVFNISYIDTHDSKCYSNKYESFRMLEIPVVDSSLMKNIHAAFQDEIFNKENDNQYFHEKTNTYIDVVKKTNIFFLPKIMIIVLKRWNNAMRKSMRIVDFGNGIIDLKEYVNKDIRDDISTTYKLKGIINHQGNVYGGHYTSLVQNKMEIIISTIVQSKILNLKN